MKKILTVILSIFYLLIFVLCLLSLTATRGFGDFFIIPAILMLLLHIVFLFNKKSYSLVFFIVICNIIFFLLPLLFFGALMPVNMILMQLIPLICSVLLGVCVLLEKRKDE